MEEITNLESKNNKAVAENDDLERQVESLRRENGNLQALMDTNKKASSGSDDLDNPLKNRLSDLSRENALLEEKLQSAVARKDTVDRKLRKMVLEMETIQATQKS